MKPWVHMLIAGWLAARATATEPTSPSPSPPALPTADTVLATYLRAVGGPDAVTRLTSRVLKGTLQTAAGTARVEIQEKATDRFLVTIDSPVGGISKNGFDGTVAWSQNPQRGVRVMSGPEVESFKREHLLHREARLREAYRDVSVERVEPIDGQDAYVLVAGSRGAASDRLFFGVADGLLLRLEVTSGGQTVQTDYLDYRVVNGVKLPFLIRRKRSDGFQWTTEFSEIVHDLPLPDSLFAPPAPR